MSSSSKRTTLAVAVVRQRVVLVAL